MTLTMHDVMKLGKLNECEIVAGHRGLNRIVKHITIIEVPEVAKWLKGNELLLTTLYSVRNDEEGQISLIHKLNAAGVSGLAIKPSQLVEIPQSIIDSANDLDFPILKIPVNIKYLDILTPVMNRLVNDKVILQEDVTQATSLLEEVLLNNRGLKVFKENLKAIINNSITIESKLLNEQLVENSQVEPLNEQQIFELILIKRPLKLMRKRDGENNPCIVAPVILEGEYSGNITSWINDDSNLSMDIAVLERAVTLLSIEFLKIKAKLEVEHRYENDFVRELLYSENVNRKNMLEWSRHFKVSNQSLSICVLFSTKHNEVEKFKEEKLNYINVYNSVKKLYPDVLIGQSGKGLSVILTVNQIEDFYNSNILSELYTAVEKNTGADSELIMGVGRAELGLKGIQTSFQQAEMALLLGENIKKDKESNVFEYDELGVFLLLDKLKDTKEIDTLYINIIGNLIEQDQNYELLNTLKAYFENDESLKITADKLFIHVNTLKYRMKKVEKITKQKFSTSEGKFNLNLALKILKMKNFSDYSE